MHIGFANQSPASVYWLMVGQGAQARATERGHTLTVLQSATLDQQLAAIHTLVAQRVDALLLGPVAARGLGDTIAQVQAAGIPVIVLAAAVNDAAAACTVRSDHMAGAELAATYLVEQLNGAGDVAHIVGPSVLQDNIDRAVGVRRVLGRHAGVRVVFEQESPNWSQASGKALTAAALAEFPDLAGVCVANDTIALGATQAIAEAGRTGEVVVTGFDASPAALIAIAEGRMSASIRQAIAEIGGSGVDMAERLVRGDEVPPLVLTPISLVTRENLLQAALEAVYLLPDVLQDAVSRGEALLHAQERLIQAQKAILRELSTPVVPIQRGVLLMSLIGAIDSTRAQQIMETLLSSVRLHATHTVILDLTGVPLVDTQIANALIHAAQAVSLLGTKVVITGIRPEIAQTLVGLGVMLRGIITCATVEDGIKYAMRHK